MGSKYIVRQPIKDTNKQIIGYEIMYHGKTKPMARRIRAVVRAIMLWPILFIMF